MSRKWQKKKTQKTVLWLETNGTMKKLQQITKPARLLKQSDGNWLIVWYCGPTRYRKHFHLNAIKDLAQREKEASLIISVINETADKSDILAIEKAVARAEIVDTKKQTFMEHVTDFIALRDGLLSRGTTKVYKTVKNSLEKYGHDVLKRSIDYQDFVPNFEISYQKWCYSAPRSYSTNYVAKHFAIIRQFLGDAKEVHRIEVGISDKKLRLKKTEVDNIALTFRQVEKLFSVQLENKLHRVVRDMFVLSCLTGLRFSDFSVLNVNNMKSVNGCIMLEVLTQKTKETVLIPLHRLAIEVLQRWEKEKKITNQVFNRYLKEVAEAAGLVDRVNLRENVGGRTRMRSFRICDILSAHDGRRTFATIAYNEWELSAGLIMKITGHRTEAMFFKYVRVTKEQAAMKVAKFFKSI